MLTESDMVKLIRETGKTILESTKKDVIGSHRVREVMSLFGLAGSIKNNGKYLLLAEVFGTLQGHLRRLPSDWKMFDADTKKELRQIIGNVVEKMLKVADSIEKKSDDLFETLGNFEVAIDGLRLKAEEISKRLPKVPSLEEMLKSS